MTKSRGSNGRRGGRGAGGAGARSPAAGEASLPDIGELVRSQVSAALHSKDTLDVIVQSITDSVTTAVMDKIQESVGRNSAEIQALRKSLAAQEKKSADLENKLIAATDELEQYQRRNSLRLFGVAENVQENTDDLVVTFAREKLGVQIDVTDIDRSHRVGRRLPGATKPRPIIIKFVSYRKRAEVFSQKRKLAKTGITVREDLTRERLKVLNVAISKFGLQNVWTQDGRIVVKTEEGKKSVTNMSELID